MMSAQPSEILSARPAMKIPFAKVDCSGNEQKYIAEVLQSGWLTTASKAKELETRFAEHIGVTHALAVNSCTSALHLALEAVGVRSGDKVLVPTMTFTSTVEVIRYLDAEPVLMDVDPRTSNVSVGIVAAALDANPGAVAVIVVHYGGQPAPMGNGARAGIVELCQARGVRLIEDAAHAFPAKLGQRFVGNFGDITCFSFYANKTMTTGEGGMVVTNNDELADRIRTMRLHGIDRPVWERFTDKRSSWEYDVIAPGFKYNMPDLNAAVGLAQLERAEAMRQQRQHCAMFYRESLIDCELLSMLDCYCEADEHSWHLFPILISPELNITRNAFIDRLSEMGVGTSVHYKPVHRLRYYREEFNFRQQDYPGAERLWESTLSLPIYGLLMRAEQQFVVDCIKQIVAESRVSAPVSMPLDLKIMQPADCS